MATNKNSSIANYMMVNSMDAKHLAKRKGGADAALGGGIIWWDLLAD